MQALAKVREAEDEFAQDKWELEGRVDDVQDIFKGIDRAVGKLDRDIQEDLLKKQLNHKEKFKMFKIGDMYKDPNSGMCRECEKGIFCQRHQLKRVYDPLKGTLAMKGAKFITKKQGARLSNLRMQQELTATIAKHNRASDIFYA